MEIGSNVSINDSWLEWIVQVSVLNAVNTVPQKAPWEWAEEAYFQLSHGWRKTLLQLNGEGPGLLDILKCTVQSHTLKNCRRSYMTFEWPSELSRRLKKKLLIIFGAQNSVLRISTKYFYKVLICAQFSRNEATIQHEGRLSSLYEYYQDFIAVLKIMPPVAKLLIVFEALIEHTYIILHFMLHSG